MDRNRRDLLKYSLAAAATTSLPHGLAQAATADIDARDRVFISSVSSVRRFLGCGSCVSTAFRQLQFRRRGVNLR
jgi:hypothetical protein